MIVEAILIFVVMVLGAGVQRVAGLGFGLVAATGASLILGPKMGVLLLNVIGLLLNVAMMGQVWSDIDWRRFRPLAVAAAVGTIPGAWIVLIAPQPVLATAVGLTLLLALGAVTVGKRYVPSMREQTAGPVFGAIAGLTATVAGIGGPPLTVYAAAAKWNGPSFVATIQPVFTVMTIATLAMKAGFGLLNVSTITWWLWPLSVVGVLVGLGAGGWIAKRVTREQGFRFTVMVATVGALAVLVEGIAELT